jgi:hypothetical protein
MLRWKWLLSITQAMGVTLEMIAVLREKYREIKRLRTVDAEHVARGQAHDPKREMAALARRFPGALRELDELPLAVIEARLAQLDEAIESHSVPEWAALQVAYHGTYRFALRIKRRAARKGALDDDALEHVIARLLAAAPELAAHAELDEPRLEELDAATLREILRPAGGRLHGWVLAQVAARAGVPAEAVAAALFLRERTLTHSF